MILICNITFAAYWLKSYLIEMGRKFGKSVPCLKKFLINHGLIEDMEVKNSID